MNDHAQLTAARPSRRAIGLPGAFVCSIALHAAALAIVWLLGLTDALTRPVEKQEVDEITFALDPQSEPEPPQEEPAGAEEPEPEPAVSTVPPPPPSLAAPQPQVETLEPSESELEPQEERLPIEDAVPPQEPEVEVDDVAGEALDPLPETAGEFLPQTPGGRPPTLDERLRDFSDAISRSQEPATPLPETDRPSNVFQPSWDNLPTTGTTLGNLRFESVDFDWEDYGRQMYWIIWRTWHNRLMDRVDDFERWAQQEGIGYLQEVNAVRFTIERSGEISNIVLETASGCIPFDLSATEALDEAVLPPLPVEFHRDREVVHAIFLGDIPVGRMRSVLRQYKAAGLF